MDGQNPSPPSMVATAKPGGPNIGLPPHLTPMMTDVMIPLPVGKLSEVSLPIVVDPIAMYSALVYRDVVMGEHGIMMHVLQLQEQDALNQGPGVAITGL